MNNLDLAKINKLLTKTIYNVIHVYVIKKAQLKKLLMKQ